MFVDGSELGLDAGADLVERAWRDLILQPLELAPELLREEICQDREELPDLDEEPLKIEDRRLDAPRILPVDLDDALGAVRTPGTRAP